MNVLMKMKQRSNDEKCIHHLQRAADLMVQHGFGVNHLENEQFGVVGPVRTGRHRHPQRAKSKVFEATSYNKVRAGLFKTTSSDSQAVQRPQRAVQRPRRDMVTIEYEPVSQGITESGEECINVRIITSRHYDRTGTARVDDSIKDEIMQIVPHPKSIDKREHMRRVQIYRRNGVDFFRDEWMLGLSYGDLEQHVRELQPKYKEGHYPHRPSLTELARLSLPAPDVETLHEYFGPDAQKSPWRAKPFGPYRKTHSED